MAPNTPFQNTPEIIHVTLNEALQILTKIHFPIRKNILAQVRSLTDSITQKNVFKVKKKKKSLKEMKM